MCHTPASRRRDSRQNNGELAVAEHVGVEASTGQTGVALAYCDTTRRVAESKGQKVSCTDTLAYMSYAFGRTFLVRIFLNKQDASRVLYERRAVFHPVV